MRNAFVSGRKLALAALFGLALLAGCIGANGVVFPWSQKQEPSRPSGQESRLEHVSTANFEERVLRSDRPVLVDFYAEWCGPCKKLGPVLEEYAQEHPEVRVVKVNVDENADLAGRYGVKAMPSLLAIRAGQVTTRSLGVVTKEKMSEMVAMPNQSSGEIAGQPPASRR